MTVTVAPEVGIPLSDNIPYMDLRIRAEAACNTAILLSEHGLDITPNKEDKDVAAGIALDCAENPASISKKVSVAKTAKDDPCVFDLDQQHIARVWAVRCRKRGAD